MPKFVFKLDGHHNVSVFADGLISCGTCSLSALVHEAILFMVKNQVRKMAVDGAEIVRLF